MQGNNLFTILISNLFCTYIYLCDYSCLSRCGANVEWYSYGKLLQLYIVRYYQYIYIYKENNQGPAKQKATLFVWS